MNQAFIAICHRCPLRERPCRHRCLCTVSGRSIKVEASEGSCPKGYHQGVPMPAAEEKAAPAAQRRPRPDGAEWGPPLWEMLHRATKDTEAVLATVTSKVPCGECKRHWREVLKELPPVHGLGWFDWTVASHNAVNGKLGKPTLSVSEARARWNHRGDSAAG